MFVLWPDAIRNDELLRANVYETGIPEPLFQFDSGANLVTSILERTVDFLVVPFEPGAVNTAVFRLRVDVPILEFNPAAGLD